MVGGDRVELGEWRGFGRGHQHGVRDSRLAGEHRHDRERRLDDDAQHSGCGDGGGQGVGLLRQWDRSGLRRDEFCDSAMGGIHGFGEPAGGGHGRTGGWVSESGVISNWDRTGL